MVARVPGLRIARAVDEHELAIRELLAQFLPREQARRACEVLVTGFGEPVASPTGGDLQSFPAVDDLVDTDLAELHLPRFAHRALVALIDELAGGGVRLHPGADWTSAREELAHVPGIATSTIESIAMRGLGDPDAFPAGHEILAEQADAWRPWRSYAFEYLTVDGQVRSAVS